MSIGFQELETPLPSQVDSDAAKFYEVVDGGIVENPPMGAREVDSCLSSSGSHWSNRRVESTGPGQLAKPCSRSIPPAS